MLTDFLLEHQWLMPSVLVPVVLLGPLVGSRLARRPRVLWALAAGSALPVLFLTLAPTDRRLHGRCELTLDTWQWPTPSRVELFANVVLFVAPVLLVTLATRRPALAFVLGTTSSAGIEAFQAVVTGLGRSCDGSDWLTNTMGAAIGAVLGWVALRLTRPAEGVSPGARPGPR